MPVADLEEYRPVGDADVRLLEVRRGVFQASRAAYHADKVRQSWSKLEDFRRSPAYYHARHVVGLSGESSEAMDFGTAAHCAILQPDEFARRYVAAPERFDMRTKAGKEAYAALADSGRTVLWPDDAARIAAMTAAVAANPIAAALMAAAGVCEYPVQWQEPRTGVWMRCLFDKAGDTPELLRRELGDHFVLDIKTTSDRTPEDFTRSCRRWGYHRQAAVYRQGALHAIGWGDCTPVLLVLPKYDHYAECWAARLSDGTVIEGDLEVLSSLRHLASCRNSGLWPSPGGDHILRLSYTHGVSFF